MDKERFDKLAGLDMPHLSGSIGTLGEKTMHAVIKDYLDPRKDNQEVRISRYYADVVNERGIFEIQTGNFGALRKKLGLFLETAPVTIVYPIAAEKYICWINGETGEVSNKRKSPRPPTKFSVLPELGYITDFLKNNNLKIMILLLSVEEYRNLDGWGNGGKRGSSRFDRLPRALLGEITLGGEHGYGELLPDDLPCRFTAKELAATLGFRGRRAYRALYALCAAGLAVPDGKEGRAAAYKLV